MKKGIVVFLAAFGILLIGTIVRFVWLGLTAPTTADTQNLVEKKLPHGSSYETVIQFLDQERFEHSDLYEGTVFAKKSIPSLNPLVEKYIMMELYFSTDKKLTSSSIYLNYTGF